MVGQFNAHQFQELNRDQEPTYIVCDDIKMPIWSYKEILEAQEQFNITDKYMAKTQIE